MIFDDVIDSIFPDCPFDHVAASLIDFNYYGFETTERGHENTWFDLASLTKVLTLASSYHQHPNLFQKDEILLLEHRGGIPAWGRLSKSNWRDTITKFPVKDSPHLYSDFSALRTMIEIEKSSGKTLKELCTPVWDEEVKQWQELPDYYHFPETGWRRKKVVRGVVHDDNAFVISEFISHAGTFGTIKGLSQTLINLDKKTNFISHIKDLFESGQKKGRFLRGWDTAEDTQNSLAGPGCSPFTFGHTGFTGTSIWIDPEKRIGWILLSNATQNYWYYRKHLNLLRRGCGEKCWNLK